MKRIICLLISFNLFYMSLGLSNNLMAQEADGKVMCTDTMKTKAFIRKGIMTKDTCFEIAGETLSLAVTGKTYDLAETIDTNVLDNSGIPNGGTVNETIIDQPGAATNNKPGGKNDSGPPAVMMPEDSFKKFGKFVRNMKNEILRLGGEAQNVQIAGTGYADGVRPKTTSQDQNIYVDAYNPLYAPAFNLLGSVPDKRDRFKQFKQIVNKFANSDKKYPINGLSDDEIKFLYKIRNLALGKARAENIVNAIINYANLSNVNPNISSETSDRLTSIDKFNFYGYCSLRRGAKVDISVPGFSTYATKVQIQDVEISPTFNTPHENDQVHMNIVAMRTFANDYEKWLLNKVKEDYIYQGSGNAHFRALLFLQSLVGAYKNQSYAIFVKLLNKNIFMPPMYILSKVEPDQYSKLKKNQEKHFDITDEDNFTKKIPQQIRKYSGKYILYDNNNYYMNHLEYFSKQNEIYKDIIAGFLDNFVLSVEEFIRTKFDISQDDILLFQDAIKWHAAAIIFSIESSKPISFHPSKIKQKLGINDNESLDLTSEAVIKAQQEAFIEEAKAINDIYKIAPIEKFRKVNSDGKHSPYFSSVNANRDNRLNEESYDNLPRANLGAIPNEDELSGIILTNYSLLRGGLFQKYRTAYTGQPESLKVSKQSIEDAYKSTFGEFAQQVFLLQDGSATEFTNDFKNKVTG
jgi:hypothetical protein